MAKTKKNAEGKSKHEITAEFIKAHPENKTAKAMHDAMKKAGIDISYPTVNAVMTGKKPQSKGKSKSNEVDLEKVSLRFALAEGGIDKAIKSLADYEEDNLARFVAECGGLENAKAELTKLKT